MNSCLTDEQCDEFRRYHGSFNAMVRNIHRAGYEKCISDMQLIDTNNAALKFEYEKDRNR